MNALKFKLVFIPYIIILFASTALTTFVNWIFFIKFTLFSVDEVVITIFIPLIIVTSLMIFTLYSRLALLTNNNRVDEIRSLFLWGFVVVIVIITQHLLISATGKLTILDTIKDITTFQKSKYSQLNKYHIDKKLYSYTTDYYVSGRNNDDFTMGIYITLPIFHLPADTLNKETPAFLGIRYSKTIDNSLSLNKKEELFQNFVTTSFEHFNKQYSVNFIYLDHIHQSTPQRNYIEAIQENSYKASDPIILLPVKEPFENRNDSTLKGLYIMILVTLLCSSLFIFFAKIDDKRLNRYMKGQKVIDPEDDILDFIKIKKEFYITPIIIYINIGIHILLCFMSLDFISFERNFLLQWGANYRPAVMDGQWWRLISSVFLHGSVVHILSNAFGLVIVGQCLEPLLGRIKFLTIYIIGGILGSVASILWHEATVSVGASGAIFALNGAVLFLVITKKIHNEITKIFACLTIMYAIVSLIMGFTSSSIDNAAHIGGFIGGLICGFFLSKKIYDKAPFEKS